ncbi:Extracellular matrix-binding ebh, putative [Babesia ovata]|uniref:Extracellular matrix-binding ebh, putative n=1 Tax=Babesia ovata TaxID=189622 RepID=A0A2H6KDQ6_9APIC|nr:Extracellular matrix-binding ebh, putative [Babesia ovata]GBE61121.1 Extracellular matrix-binding ebh, putative [Babesia ovata]
MDGDLKRDLKSVKDKIKDGIKEVIRKLGVETLDQKVKTDLGNLKRKIEGLRDEVTGSEIGNSKIVSKQLEELKRHKGTLDNTTSSSGSIHKAMSELDQKFQAVIQQPLSRAVTAVDSAIGELGGKFSLSVDKQNVQGIFGYIKEKVGEIKGTPGQNGRGGKGVDGIVARFKAYVTGVGENMKKETGTDGTVHSWLDKILTHNGVVVYRLGKYFGENKGGQLNTYYTKPAQLHAPIRDQTKAKLKEAGVYDEAKGQHEIKNNGPLTDRLASLKEFLEKYASVLDGKINVDNNTFVTDLVSKIEGAVKNGNHHSDYKQENLTSTVEATLAALTADARRTAGEINSLLLNVDRSGQPTDGSVAKFLDKTKEITDDLDSKLTQATSPPKPDPAGTSTESPAQAVDSRLKEVRDMVNTKIEGTFTTEVTKDLAAAVSELPTAVDNFNQQAQEQIRAAATTAIEKAAGQISEKGQEIKLDENGLMSTFETAHGKIRKDLDSELKKQVDKHIGQDDNTGGQADKVSITKDQFGSYYKHVVQPVNGTLTGKYSEGKLPEAIGKIESEGLEALEDKIGIKASGKAEITDATFTGPFKAIEDGLGDIGKMVDSEGTYFMDDTNRGITQFLDDLRSMIGNGTTSMFFTNTLEKIRPAIEKLHNKQFTSGPKEIDQAVTAIKGQLKELKEKLKNKLKPGDDVINALTILQRHGLSSTTWQNGKHFWPTNGNNGVTVDGLGKIEEDLKAQNDQLAKQNSKIGEAIWEIKKALACLGFKIQGLYTTDDVIDQLVWLGKLIGKGTDKAKNNLQGIYVKIKQLQEGEFTQKPQAIEQANEEIKAELTTLQNELQGSQGNDVIKTLEDLQSTGLGGGDWKKDDNEKGLAKINSELQGQQNTLGQQPGEIQTGVSQITTEFQRLQKQLTEEVTEKLKKLRESGLGSGQTWDIDDNSAKGLTKITADIATIKTKDVEDLKDKLKELCTAIRTEANELSRDLKRLKGDGLTEMKKIYSDLYDLYFGPLNDVIQSLKAFDKYAVLAASLICF